MRETGTGLFWKRQERYNDKSPRFSISKIPELADYVKQQKGQSDNHIRHTVSCHMELPNASPRRLIDRGYCGGPLYSTSLYTSAP